jgi:hypothetical protein
MKKTHLIIAIIIIILLGVGAFVASQMSSDVTTGPVVETPDETVLPVEPDGGIGDGTGAPEDSPATEPRSSLATTDGGNELVAYHFGSGTREVVLVTGVHGGYSWGTAELGFEMVEYFEANPSAIPDDVRVTVIPVLNPDGLASVLGSADSIDRTAALALTDTQRTTARFNANDVDLNRNFDCEWSASGTWQNRTVSGGSAPFSEPEAAALRDYVIATDPVAAVVWFSAEGKVYPSACGGTPNNASVTLASTFAAAANYPVEASFDAYAITGDMVNWMAKEGVPAISVLLSSHTDTEWNKNRAGVEAVLNSVAN